MGLEEYTTTLSSGGVPGHFRTDCLGGLNHSALVTPLSRTEGSLHQSLPCSPNSAPGSRGTQHTPDVAMQQVGLCTHGISKSFFFFFYHFLHVYLCVCVPLCRGQEESFRS